MNYLVTGATGGFGGYALDFLKESVLNSEIYALVRSEEKGEGLKKAGFNIRIGDYADAESMIAAVLLQSSKMNNTSLTLAIVYAGIPNNIFISVQTENPKRVPSFRFFLYNPRMASMPLIVVEAVRKLR